MFQEKRKYNMSLPLIVVCLVTVMGISGCGYFPKTDLLTFGQNPVVTTAPKHEGADNNSAIAYQHVPTYNEEDGSYADYSEIIMAQNLTSGAHIWIENINSPVPAPQPVQLVAAGDRYFLAWIDTTEPPARLRWRFLTTDNMEQFGQEGGYRQVGGLISEFAAAYHPANDTILVAFLTQPAESDSGHIHTPIDSNQVYKQCVEEIQILDEVIMNTHCQAHFLTVSTANGEITSHHSIGGWARALSIEAGMGGFLVAAAMSDVSEDHGNSVRFYPFDESGRPLPTPNSNGFVVTGRSDCADDPASIIGSGDRIVFGNVEKAASNYSATTIAYNPDSGRYLIGYTSACDNSHFRARWVKSVDGGWLVYGVTESTYTSTSDGIEGRVLAPPFEIMNSGPDDVWHTTNPVLSYNQSWGRYVAGFGSYWNPWVQGTAPDYLPKTDYFFQQQLWAVEEEPGRYSEVLYRCRFPKPTSLEKFEPAHTTSGDFVLEPAGWEFVDFVSGSIVTDVEGSPRKTYYAWQQTRTFIPCLDQASEYSTDCPTDELDFSNADLKPPRPDLYFGHLDNPPSSSLCEEISAASE